MAGFEAVEFLLPYAHPAAQRMEGAIAATLQKYLPRIGHVQLADNPGRNEPAGPPYKGCSV